MTTRPADKSRGAETPSAPTPPATPPPQSPARALERADGTPAGELAQSAPKPSSRRLGPLRDAVLVGGLSAAAAAALLIGSLFMSWYKEDLGTDVSAWTAFNGYDVALFVVALILGGTSIVVALGRLRLARKPLRILSTVAIVGASALAVMVLIKLQSPPHGWTVRYGGGVAFFSICVAAIGACLMNIPLWAPARRDRPERRPAAGAGWYADPTEPGRLRYWDGSKWTGHIHQPPGAR